MFGGRIDDHVHPAWHRAGENRRGKDVIDNHLGPDRVGQPDHRGNVDHFKRRVRHGFKEHNLGVGADCSPPLIEIGAIDKIDLDPVAGENFLKHIEARPEKSARGDHVIASAEHGGQGSGHRRHAGRGGKGVFGAFERGNAFFEHAHGRVAVSRVDEFVVAGLDKAGFGLFGAVIGKALCQKDRLAQFAILAPAGATVHGGGARVPFGVH